MTTADHVLMTGDDYRESLRRRKALKVFMNGERLEEIVDNPIIAPSINSVALTYDFAHRPEMQHLSTAASSLSGKTINRFCHLHQSTDDLIKKVELQRILGRMTGTCFQRCVGLDALNATFITTYEIDEKHGTDYHQRFIRYIEEAQARDWTIDGCMTDVKGDRGKRPEEQSDPDLYVRVVETRPDGIVIRGAKAHQTGAINSHEHLLMPTIAMRETAKAYAVCCAVPVDAEGITYIYGRQSCDLRKNDTSEAGQIDCGNSCYGGQECLVVFDDVFVPNERVFMNG